VTLSGGATEIFQEGVRIPPIRIVERGKPKARELRYARSRIASAVSSACVR
jgi:N-methylhydantoinase B/oxoprolinase/acetone carboxylase alpha subunit